MKNVFKQGVRPAIVLLGVLAIAMLVGPLGPLAQAGAAVPLATGIAGFGFWDSIACIACISAFLIGSGTTVAGLAVFLAVNPELTVLCVSSCAAAM